MGRPVGVAWLVGLLLCSIFCQGVWGGGNRKRVLVWMCLERCGFTEADISQHMNQLALRKDVVTDVAFELFNLGPNSTLVTNKLHPVARKLKREGFATYAMISSFPYPPQFLEYMRQVFAYPEPFIEDLITQGQRLGLTGYNIDWEPTAKGGIPTKKDAKDYAAFLTLVADRLHRKGMRVNIAFATWSPIWDWPALKASTLDGFMLMSTYTNNWNYWQKDAKLGVDTFGGRLGIGLEVQNPASKPPSNFTESEMDIRFDWISKHPVQTLAIWDAGIPKFWWPHLKNFRGVQ